MLSTEKIMIKINNFFCCMYIIVVIKCDVWQYPELLPNGVLKGKCIAGKNINCASICNS